MKVIEKQLDNHTNKFMINFFTDDGNFFKNKSSRIMKNGIIKDKPDTI
jgi:hypothetical protein